MLLSVAGPLALTLLALALLALSLLLAAWLLTLTLLLSLTLLALLAAGLLRLAAAGALLLFEALAQLALLVGEFLALLGARAVALGLFRCVIEIALIIHSAVGVLKCAVHGAVHRAVGLLSALSAAAHLDLHVLHLLEHALHVVEQLASLIACAGFGKVAQGLQHAGEFIVAHLRAAAALHALHLVALRDVAVAQRLGHLSGEVVLDGLFVHIHQALDFFFRSASAESVFQCAAGGLKRGGGVGERAELGLKRDLP